MQQENEVPTQKSWKCYCVCVGLQNKIHMFREHLCPSLPGKSQKKLNLPKRLLAKIQPFFIDVTIIVLTEQIRILELAKKSAKTCEL